MPKKYNHAVHGKLNIQIVSILADGKVTMLLASLGIVFFVTSCFIAFPIVLAQLALAAFVASMVYLTGILYGILNDFFAVKASRAYFMIGHQPNQGSLIKSNSIPSLAIAWGILATHGLSLIAGILFAIAVFIAAFFVTIPMFIPTILLLGMPLFVLAAHTFSNWKTGALKDVNQEFRNWWKDEIQETQIRDMNFDIDDKRSWLSNGYRNGFGYAVMPLLGVVGMITLFTVNVGAFLSVGLFATLFPISVGGLAILLVGIALVYLKVNHEKQDTDYHQLVFDETTPASLRKLGDIDVSPRKNSEPFRSQEKGYPGSAGRKRDASVSGDTRENRINL
ncbi:MAG: hypothetical protein NTW08_02070 [Gammaproteobacteria bacterium]|nr:hypothetical protein [Gammaproteobacteria bacterium]